MEYWIPLLSAFGGAVIGSATSIITIWMQSARDDRRHLREIAAKLALDDRNIHFELVKTKGGGIYPTATYFAHHLRILEAASRGKLTAEKYIEISKLDEQLRNAVSKRDDEMRDNN